MIWDSSILALTGADLIGGNNVVYVVLFATGLFFTLMSVIGLGAHSEADLDASAEADADLDLHADADADLDADLHADVDVHADADADAHAESDADGDADGDVSLFQNALSFLGVGKAPLSVLMTLLCYSAALIGSATNLSLARPLGVVTAFRISLAAAIVGAVLVTRSTSRLIARWLPTYYSTAQTRGQLVGLRGEVTIPVGERFGQVFVRDRFGTLNTFNCKTLPGAAPIAKGTTVVLTKYTPEDDTFYVSPA